MPQKTEVFVMKKVVDIELTSAKCAGFSLSADESENLLNCRDLLFGEREDDFKTVRQELLEKKEAAKLQNAAMFIGLSGFAVMVITFLAFLL